MLVDGVRIIVNEKDELEFIIPADMGARKLKEWKKRYIFAFQEKKS